MCVEHTYTYYCGHKSFEDWPCEQFGTRDYLFCYISQREENAGSSCDECEENFDALTERSKIYLSACQRSLVPLLMRLEFISDRTGSHQKVYSTILGKRDALRAILRRAETRATQVPLLMAQRTRLYLKMHRVGDAQPGKVDYERELQDVERQLGHFHDQLSTETQPDAYIVELLAECDVDFFFHRLSSV